MHVFPRFCWSLLLLFLFVAIPQVGFAKEPASEWEANPLFVAKSEQRNRDKPPEEQYNYREDKVPEYTLPPLMKPEDGQRIKTDDAWESKRRPELLELFRTHVYGRAPLQKPEQMEFNVYDVDRKAMGGKATRKQVTITLNKGGKSLAINVVIFIPNAAKTPAPGFLLICNRGKENIDPTREKKVDFWPAEQIVARGYVAAAFHNADVDPDNYDEFQNGVHGLYDEQPRSDDAWGTLAAWAWGASRVMDYFATDDQIDEKHIAVIGHSRGGKTSLWAGAEDERFAMVISNNSGCGGAALSRRKFGETVQRINTSFPHWFCKNFRQYNDNESELPVDQHMLAALIAPRLLYIASADDDLWADPRGEFLTAMHASAAYQLYERTGLGTDTMPALNEPVQKGRIGYHVRSGGHGLTLYDWNQYMDFADKHGWQN